MLEVLIFIAGVAFGALLMFGLILYGGTSETDGY